ncbi:MAG: ABC transporter substrate-binding protein [Solirubrobacteraceae bacterium]|nr:ABC transporter substrate-binding protein [Patulibacter sp.]
MARVRRIASALVATVLAAGGLAGCGSSGDGSGDDVGQGDANTTPVSLAVAVDALPSTLDPALARTPSERVIAAAINTPLLTYRRSTDTDAATLEPALAGDLPTLSDDATEYRFTLRPGLLYADGQVVTASDVERSIAHASVAAVDPELRAVLDDIEGAPSADGQTLSGVVSDDSTGTVVVKLRHPDGRIPLALADPATAPLPALPARDLKTLPSSTGPLRVARVTATSIELVANPLRARIATVPAAHATQVSITTREPTAAALASGAVDLVLDPAAGKVPAKMTAIDASSGAVWSLVLPARGEFSARTVRQDLAQALDRRGLAAATDPTVRSTTPRGASGTTPSTGASSTTPSGGEVSTTPITTHGSSMVDEDVDGGLVPACGLLPAYVVGAVVRDDCPPSPTITKTKPLLGETVRVAVASAGVGEQASAQVVATAVEALGGQAVFVRAADPAHAALSTNSSADAAIVRASPSLPHPAGWLGAASEVDDLIHREVLADTAGPLTGSADRWSSLEKRAVQRAVVVPIAVGRTQVLVGPAIARSSVQIHPVLGLDLTALAPR